jgi:Putative zinc-binding metallo-peptidase
MRLCDLKLTLAGSQLEPMRDELYTELKLRGIRYRPHVWLSDEWFTPDGVGGIAAPFYLAHPRLRELEQNQMLEVEGGTPDWCMRILRHEAGHALDNAHRLHRRKRYRELFGSWHQPYPDSYRPRPNTKRYVIHLDMWYAQAHPAEDFAETFAVWLNPQSNWREQYATWPALRKLEFVNETIDEVGTNPAVVTSRRAAHPMCSLRHTLREHYERRRKYYCRDSPGFYDRDLRRIFSDLADVAANQDAARFIEASRTELRVMVSRWTGASSLTIDRTLADMVKRVDALGLKLRKSLAETRVDVMMMLAVQTMNFVNDGKHRVIL